MSVNIFIHSVAVSAMNKHPDGENPE